MSLHHILPPSHCFLRTCCAFLVPAVSTLNTACPTSSLLTSDDRCTEQVHFRTLLVFTLDVFTGWNAITFLANQCICRVSHSNLLWNLLQPTAQLLATALLATLYCSSSELEHASFLICYQKFPPLVFCGHISCKKALFLSKKAHSFSEVAILLGRRPVKIDVTSVDALQGPHAMALSRSVLFQYLCVDAIVCQWLPKRNRKIIEWNLWTTNMSTGDLL